MSILFFVLSFFLFTVQGKMNFERNIWVYWETNFDQAPLVTRISFEKLQKAAKESNWSVVLINGTNVRNYLKEYDRFEDVVKRGHRQTVQQKSDILRISLVEQNGGVWIDFACVLFDDLQWLSDQKLFEHMIINRIGSNLDDPDMFMLGEGWHQSPLSYYNQNGSLVSDEYFGMAIHFIAAKKKSKIMTEWKQKMYRICTLPYSEYIKQINEKRLYFHNIDRDSMYYSGNLALQSLIQQKQFQFDSNLTLFSQRKNAYEHYKIWSIHGQVGPIAMTRKHIFRERDLFMQTKQEVEQRLGKLWFYLKMAKFLRERIDQYKESSQKYFRQNQGLTVETILKRGPTNQQCQLFYIVKGSILYNFYKGSKYESEIHTPYITVEQREELKKHCQFIAPLVYYSWYFSKSQGQMTRPQRELFYNQTNTLTGKIKMFWVTNLLVITAGFQQWRTIVFTLIFYIILRNSSSKDLLKAFLDRYRNKYNEKVPFYQMLKNRLNTLQKTFDQQGQPVDYKQVKWSRQKSIAVFILFMKTILGSVSLQFYENIQDLGRYPQYEFSLFIMVVIIFVDKWLQKLSDKTNFPLNMFVSMETVSKGMRFVIYLPLGFVIFIHWDIIYGLTYYHTLIVVGGGLILYMLLEQLKRKGLQSKFTNFVMFLMQMSKWMCLAIFLAFYLIKNLRYIRHDNHYIKQSLSDIAMYIFTALFTSTILLLNIQLVRRLLSGQYQNQQQQNDTVNKSDIKQMLVSINVVAVIVLKTHMIYCVISQSPSSHNLFQSYQFLVLLFIACGLSTQLKIPDLLDLRRKLCMYFYVYSVLLIYVIFGLYMLDNIFMNWVVNFLILIPFCMYVGGIGFMIQQLNMEDSEFEEGQQDGDIQYEVIRTHEDLKYDTQRS